MKKLISVLLLLAIVVSVFCSSLATSFDYTQLKNLDGYKYDKFGKSWTYNRAYIKAYADAYVVVGATLEGDESGISYPPMLFFKILDADGKSMYTASKAYFIVGDKLYSFENLIPTGDLAGVFLGTTGKELIEAFSTASDISVKIEFDYKSLDFDIKESDFTDTLKAFSKTLVKYNVFSLFNEADLLTYDIFFNSTVE